MKYKIIDVEKYTEENVQFGTCDLCMSVGDLEHETIVLSDENGTIWNIETGVWDWGDYMTMIYLENVVDFGAWLSTKEIAGEIDVYKLRDLVDEYEEATK